MFDIVAITAANEAQARGYRALTAGRRNVYSIPDPGGRRVGSLGATVNTLNKLWNKIPGAKAGSPSGTLLVCHSGGDARRTPGYAAMGKAFIPLKDGRSLFDHIVSFMSRLRLPAAGGVLVVSGDVLPRFDAAAASFGAAGVTGVAYADGAGEARRHGVYVAAPGRTALRRVSAFVQKPQVSGGRHLIDTGIMFIDWPTASKMRNLPVAGDIYDEFPSMLLGGFARFNVNIVPKCTFFHVGTTREVLDRLGDGNTYVDSVGCRLKLAGRNVVTNVPAGRFKTLSLAEGECFTCIPVGKEGWYDLKYRIDDNFKTDGLWEKHGLAEKMKKIDYARLLAARRASGGKTVTATLPVRIDFAGGWSDTPPICCDKGGAVFNVAVDLDGRRPVSVTVKQRKDKFVRIVSKDLGKTRIVRTAAELADHSDPSDWCALAKSALAVTGFEFGSRGIDLIMSAELPKGSGMGTSSILGAAAVAALTGKTDAAEISGLVLALEKEMGTDGGWQDQYGGLEGGFKLLESKPGSKQQVAVTCVQPPRAALKALRERALLYFTGQKRMARNILRKVVAFYAANPHGFGDILVDSLKRGAKECASALARGDLKAFASAVNGYWRDKKLLDPGSTNERVEAIIEKISPFTDALTLTGAGGGGFMFILAKSAAAAKRIKRTLEADKPSVYSRFYSIEVDEAGLQVEIT